MTGSKVLIVKLPELHADVKALEAFRAYVCDALGAVEVGAGNAVPVVIGGPKPTPAGGGGGLVVGGRVVRSVPDLGTAPEPERAEETNPKSINPLPESEKTPKTDLSNRTVSVRPMTRRSVRLRRSGRCR